MIPGDKQLGKMQGMNGKVQTRNNSEFFPGINPPLEILRQWISNIRMSNIPPGPGAWVGAFLLGCTPEIVICIAEFKFYVSKFSFQNPGDSGGDIHLGACISSILILKAELSNLCNPSTNSKDFSSDPFKYR